MNAHDPKFTAYLLGELDPAESAAIDVELRAQPALAAELEDLRRFTAQLQGVLHAEEGAPLRPEQRAAVLGQLPRVAAGPLAWWRRTWVQSAAAACVIVGVSAAIVARMQMKEPVARVAGMREQGTTLRLEPEPEAKDAPGDVVEWPATAPDPARTKALQPEVVAVTSPSASGGGLGAGSPQSKLDFLASIPAAPVPATAPGLPLAQPPAVLAKNTRAMPVRSLADAQGLYEAGRYDVAMKWVDKTLKEDPSNLPARQLQERIREERERGASFSYQETRSRMLWKEDKGWDSPVRRDHYAAAADARPLPPDAAARGLDRGGADAPPADPLQAPEEGTPADRSANTEAYDTIADNAFIAVKDQPLSTFAVDVDTASYANVRRFLNANERPPKGAVRIEELVNYFRYDYPRPKGAEPFSCALEVATCPWQTEHRLVRIGLKGREVMSRELMNMKPEELRDVQRVLGSEETQALIKRESRPAANLVFLIDVSGSMAPENRLPLVKQSLGLLVDQLTAEDTVSIAVYAGNSGCVLEPTHDRNQMRAALDRLEAGDSTNGAAGIQLAYDLAQRSFKKGGTNRVILCTDGDFNVGITSQSELVAMIQDKAKTGIFLSVFGVGMGNLKDATLEKLADKGHGNYGYIDTLAEGRKLFVEQMTGTLFTIAKDVKVQVEFNPAQVGAYRLIGYEDRLLAKEDFNNDAKSGGDIGAGHTVTALYEVVPAGRAVPGAPVVDDLKYQPGAGVEKSAAQNPKTDVSPELLTVKLRYKQPEGDVSRKLEFPLTDGGATWAKSSRDFRWAASVASFGLLLRDSPNKGSANWDMTLELATEGKGDDRDGYRSEFVGLVEKARALSR